MKKYFSEIKRKKIAKVILSLQNRKLLTDALIGVLKNDYNEKEMKEEMIKKY